MDMINKRKENVHVFIELYVRHDDYHLTCTVHL